MATLNTTPRKSVLENWADWFDAALARLADQWRDLGVAAFLGVAAVIITLISYNFAQQIILPGMLSVSDPGTWNDWWNGFFQNFGTEMFGALATFILLQGIVGAREKASDRQLQEQIASGIRAELRRYIQAQEIARLRNAATAEERQPIIDSMRATDLFEEAGLGRTNLDGGLLRHVNLRSAHLFRASLNDASLFEADMSNVGLRDTSLEGTSLIRADLTGALFVTIEQLRSAETLSGAILPDGIELPEDDWKVAFEEWARAVSVQEVRKDYINGNYIVPMRTDENQATWDKYFG